jgi:hemerythrin-like domain-containing protein
MKRHPSLRDLSSDHHQGLVQARRLVQAAEGTLPVPGDSAAGVVHDFLHFWAEEINHHFREEEEVLLPAFARYDDPAAAPVVRMLVEHVRIRRLVDDLQTQLAGGAPEPATMQATGDLLREHIRHEENVVFPLIETTMPEDALALLAQQLLQYTS